MSLIVGFGCLTKSLEIIKTDNRSLCCCNSLHFYFSDHIKIANFLMLSKRATSYGYFNRKKVCKNNFFCIFQGTLVKHVVKVQPQKFIMA